MNTKNATWFEAKISYQKKYNVDEDGFVKSTTELYAVDAETFTEAETRVCDYAKEFSADEPIEVASLKRADYNEILFSDSEKDDRWYKIKIAYVTTSGKTGKEKRTYTSYLVQADSIDTANAYMKEFMKVTISDYVIEASQETKIMDVIEYV